jgi:GDP-L-fucose synthase
MNLENKKILVTGGNGFLGRVVVEKLTKLNVKSIISPSSKELDLRLQSNCKKAVHDVDVVFHLAGKGGGIEYMRNNPAETFYDNIMMGTQLINEAKNENIEKFIALGTVCSYPKFSSIPFTENNFWEGYPEETNAAYGLSKKMMTVQSEAYRNQFNFNSISVIPTNLFGPGDDFNPNTSHVIPGIISKISKAMLTNSKEIILWGDGTPTRDFLYVEDAADGIILAGEKYNDSYPLNLGAQKEISIKELGNMISKLMNFDGNINWDTTKPNGQPRRCVSNEMAEQKIGFIPKMSLEDGLKKIIAWHKSQNFS